MNTAAHRDDVRDLREMVTKGIWGSAPPSQRTSKASGVRRGQGEGPAEFRDRREGHRREAAGRTQGRGRRGRLTRLLSSRRPELLRSWTESWKDGPVGVAEGSPGGVGDGMRKSSNGRLKPRRDLGRAGRGAAPHMLLENPASKVRGP